MINVSKEFQLLMNERSDFKQNAEITFVDGTTINLTEEDFCISNNNVVDASDKSVIPLGVAVCRNIQIELINDNDRFSTYDFFGAVIRLYLTFQLSETMERIEYGTFTVLTPETYGETVIITALDDMHKADKEYSTSLAFPASVKAILIDACDALDIPLGTTTFLNDDFVVNKRPEDLTFRQLFGYIAMIAGGNARIDRTGRLRVITYDFANMESIYNSVLNGGAYIPWDNPVNVDGGSFAPWNNGDDVDGGSYGDRNGFHVLGNWRNLKIETDDVVITGIQTTYKDAEKKEQTILNGVEGYVLSIKNPLISGKEEQALSLIGNVMIGGRFRPFNGDIVANPTCEFMDLALLLDRKGNVYISFLTDVNFQFFGFTSIKNSAEPALRNSAKIYSESAKALIQAKELIEEEKTARELAVEQLAKDLSNSSGLYVSTESQADGSKIYYMHDKPTLAESMIVWKLTSLAFGISTDGGETYPYGFTVDGETITRLLYADGIDVKNLVVGENVQMGPKATISWNNVTDKSNVANKIDIPSDNEICDIILENRGTIITKEYIGTLKVVAGSVAAENITGDLFSGKKYVSNIAVGTYETQTSIDGGTITSQITNGSAKTVLDYFGLDVISSNGQQKTEIGSTEIKISSSLGSETSLNTSEFILKDSYSQTKITKNSLYIKDMSDNDVSEIEGKLIKSYGGTTDYATIDGKTITSFGSAYNYTTVKGAEIYLYNGNTKNLTITSDAITFASNASIKYGTTALMEFASNSVTVKGSNTYLGAASGYLGFFGTTTKSTKKSVTTIASPSLADASTVATKVNEIINALKAYNLI